MGNTVSSLAGGIQSVDRAVDVLEILGRRGECGVTEVALELGVHKSTASRLLAVLLDRGLVEQTAERGPFRLGMGLVRLAGQVSAVRQPYSASSAVTKALSAEVGETVNIAVLDGDQAVYLDQVAGTNVMSFRSWLGQRVPTHASATGKALTAWLPTKERAAARPKTLVRLTDRTITSVRELEAELARVRVDGYSAAIEELEVGLAAIAAPVRDAHGTVVATVAVSGPSFRITPDRYDDIAAKVVAAAAQLSGTGDFA